MKTTKYLMACAALAWAFTGFEPAQAQNKLVDDAFPVIIAPHSQNVSYRERTLCFDITANVDFTVTTDADWVTIRKTDDGAVYVHLQANNTDVARTANVVFANAEHKLKETLTISQFRNQSIEDTQVRDDKKIRVISGSANTSEEVHPFKYTFDGNTSSFWHSQWTGSRFTVSSTNPAKLTYNFAPGSHIDYFEYTTRGDGQENGNFGVVDVMVKKGNSASYTKALTQDFGFVSGTHKVVFEDGGLDDVRSIRFDVKSGTGAYASCGEMEFYQVSDGLQASAKDLFTDATLSELKPGVTAEDIEKYDDEYLCSLAKQLLDGTYTKDYRVAEYTAKLNYAVQAQMWGAPGKHYDQRQGVTGINITKGKQGIAVAGLPEGQTVPMVVTAWYEGKEGGNFDGGNPQHFYYNLRNGLNVIDYGFDYDGLAYICYYADANPELQPKLKIHFINGIVNGYLSPDKTNEEMHELTAKAPNTCMDVVGRKVHSIWTSQGLHDYCRAIDGSIGYRQYMNVIDSLIQWEHDLLGFVKYDHVPDNRTCAYVNYTYYMFQGGLGVSFHHDQESRVLNCNKLVNHDDDAIWGLSHEWGHQHQMQPYFNWGGMCEVTNNMNSYYNIMKMGYHSSDKINNWKPARRHFVDQSYGDIDRTSEHRYEMYKRAGKFRDMGLTDLYNFCLTMEDSVITHPQSNKFKALTINEVGAGETLCPFIMLYNYFSYVKGLKDFAPDWYEAMRQNDNEEGSMIEKQNGIDKYELLASMQNNNKNNKRTVLEKKFPNSCWVTKKYWSSQMGVRDNNVPYIMNYIRKVSRLSGYNLFPYFEQWGFLRQVAMYVGDYGDTYYIMTPEMYDEFKADMDALVESGELKAMPDGMVREISETKDLFDIPGSGFGDKPEFPN